MLPKALDLRYKRSQESNEIFNTPVSYDVDTSGAYKPTRREIRDEEILFDYLVLVRARLFALTLAKMLLNMVNLAC